MQFEVIRSDRKTLSIEISPDRVIIKAPRLATNEEINAFMLKNKAWIDRHLAAAQARKQAMDRVEPLTPEQLRQLADRAAAYIPERVRHFAPLVGVTYGRITIRNQRSKWGSCSSAGNLNFNCLLMLAPPEVIDSVVVHELCHRKEMNHSEKFYAEVTRVCPEYEKHHRWLKENGELLMRMMPG